MLLYELCKCDVRNKMKKNKLKTVFKDVVTPTQNIKQFSNNLKQQFELQENPYQKNN